MGQEIGAIGKISTVDSTEFFQHNRTDQAAIGTGKSMGNQSTFSTEANKFKYELTSSSNSKTKTLQSIQSEHDEDSED